MIRISNDKHSILGEENKDESMIEDNLNENYVVANFASQEIVKDNEECSAEIMPAETENQISNVNEVAKE